MLSFAIMLAGDKLVNGAEEGGQRLVPWKASDVLLGIGAVLVVLLVIAVAYAALAADPLSGPGISVIGAATGAVLLAISWAMGPAKNGASLRSLGLVRPSVGGFWGLGLPLLVLITSLGLTALYSGVVSLLGWETPQTILEDIDLKGPVVYASFTVVLVLWGPLTEEVFFRGFIYSGLVPRMGLTGATVASALLFALFHTDPRVMAPIFTTGLLLAWLYRRTGSIWGCVAAHAGQNGIALLLSVGS